MGWFNDTLKFDIDAIQKMRKNIQNTAADLKSQKNQLKDELDKLKRDWRTPAGKQFMNDTNTGWIEKVDSYVKIIDGVDRLLQEAETKYREVVSEAGRIRLG